MNAALPIVFLTLMTAGSLLTAVVGRLRRGADPVSGHGCPRTRCYLGVALTPAGDRTLIVVSGVGAAVAACVPSRDGAERTSRPGGTVTDAAGRSEPAETPGVETAWVGTGLPTILRAAPPQRAADLSPSGSSNRTTSR